MTIFAVGARQTHQRQASISGVASPPRPWWPALEGLRGAAVLAVLVHHHEVGWAPGGHLGVSTFFTLSGFLICGLLLERSTADGRVDLLRFWGGRVRRLLPAASVVLVLTALVFWFRGLSERFIAAEATDAALYSANWRPVSYMTGGDVGGIPSPFGHYWSLAVEEQFYLVFPLVLAAVLSVYTWRRGQGDPSRWLATGLVALAVLSLVVGLLLGPSQRFYRGTDARAFELLAGALLAVWLWRRPPGRAARAVGLAALLAAAAIWLWGPAPWETWTYRGGFAAYALVSAAIVYAATATRGPVVAALSSWPLAKLGLISYGVYLLHWPVYFLLNESSTGWGTAAVFVVRVSVTMAIAVGLFILVERPLRHRDRVPTSWLWLGAVAAPIAVSWLLVAA